MKQHTKIVLLVALALFLTLTACTRQASTAAVTKPTTTADAPFPVNTPGTNLGQFGTQTAMASTPVAPQPTTAPEVNVTPVPSGTGGDQPGSGEAGGGQSVPAPTQQGGVPAPSQNIPAPAIVVPSTYVLEKGEWPICIARRFNLDISTFFSANGLNMNSKPGVGTTLKIPANSTWSSVYGERAWHSHPTTYTVASGDTVNSIACYFGDVSPEQILTVNSMQAGDIKAGVKLNIP